MDWNPPRAGQDRRSHNRFLICRTYQLRTHENGPKYLMQTVVCHDVSQGGALILSLKALPTRISLEFRSPDGEARWFDAEILRERKYTGSVWEYGLKFDRLIPHKFIDHMITESLRLDAIPAVTEVEYVPAS